LEIPGAPPGKGKVSELKGWSFERDPSRRAQHTATHSLYKRPNGKGSKQKGLRGAVTKRRKVILKANGPDIIGGGVFGQKRRKVTGEN